MRAHAEVVVMSLFHGQVMMYMQEEVPKPFLLISSQYSCTWVNRWISWSNKGGGNPLPIATTPCNMHLMSHAMLTILLPLAAVSSPNVYIIWDVPGSQAQI